MLKLITYGKAISLVLQQQLTHLPHVIG